MPNNLRVRKRQAVREAIYEAAIKQFSEHGFDETTVEQVAGAAGVSRRSFFRYFASKDDLLAQNALNYGAALSQAIVKCPLDVSLLELMKEIVKSGVQYAATPNSRTREIVTIAVRSSSARRAYQSRHMDVEDLLMQAFVDRFKSASPCDENPRLLAGLTLAIMNATVSSWFEGKHKSLSIAAKNVFQNLVQTFSEV